MENNDFAVWPPYLAFYVESMLFRTSAALNAVESANSALLYISENRNADNLHQAEQFVLDEIQSIVMHGAGLSRFFWPSRDGENNLHKRRAQLLRAELGVKETSPLRNRDLRNQIEHYDEAMDKFLKDGVFGRFLPSYVGPYDPPEVKIHLFRAFYTDIGKLEILGVSYEVNKLVEEISRVHDILEGYRKNGKF